MNETNKINRHLTPRWSLLRHLAIDNPIHKGHYYNVSVSHRHQLIWYRVAKVGTRSLIELMQNSDPDLILNYSRWRNLSSSKLKGYNAIAFVRNPYDRLISAWRNKVVDANKFLLSDELREELQDFDAFVQYIARFDLQWSDPHIRPQRYLMDLERLSHIGKMENFSEDCSRILPLVGVPVDNLSRKNASSRTESDSLELYSQESIDIVNKHYACDFESFGYEKV